MSSMAPRLVLLGVLGIGAVVALAAIAPVLAQVGQAFTLLPR